VPSQCVSTGTLCCGLCLLWSARLIAVVIVFWQFSDSFLTVFWQFSPCFRHVFSCLLATTAEASALSPSAQAVASKHVTHFVKNHGRKKKILRLRKISKKRSVETTSTSATKLQRKLHHSSQGGKTVKNRQPQAATSAK
jgi:hypothetical protein